MIQKKAICLLTIILFGIGTALSAESVTVPEPAATAAEQTADTAETEEAEDSVLLDTLGIDVHDKTIQADETKAFRTILQSVTHLISEGTGKIVNWQGFELKRVIIAVGGSLLSLLFSLFLRWLIKNHWWKLTSKLFPTKNPGSICALLAGPLAALLLFSGVFLCFLPMLLCLPERGYLFFEKLYFGLITIAVTALILNLFKLFDSVLLKFFSRNRKSNSMDNLAVKVISRVIQIVIIMFAFFFLCENVLGINITAILAGAGVIGLGIAFAAQDTIANFFGSLMIILDRPFKVNDFIRIDGREGTVERVGLRSTGLRTPDGFLITIPNKTAANVTIEDVSCRPTIKRVMTLGLVYDTPPEKMERAVAILHEILDGHESIDPKNPPKIHFLEFASCSLNIQVILWFNTRDFWQSLDWADEINRAILKRFNGEGLEFAFPTSTTYLAYDSKREVEIKVKEVPQSSGNGAETGKGGTA